MLSLIRTELKNLKYSHQNKMLVKQIRKKCRIYFRIKQSNCCMLRYKSVD